MKKTIITAFVVLLVMLAFVTCDGFITEPGAEKAEYTADGQKLVTLKVNISGTAGNSRSLSDLIARGAANYAEVIFRQNLASDPINDPPVYKYYRGQGFFRLPITVKVPVQVYDEGEAIILIGRRIGTDTQLLATGIVTGGCDLPDLLANATSSTITVSFTVTSLVADLTADASTPAFTIDPTSLTDTTFTDYLNLGSFNDDEDLCFLVPINETAISATLAIDGFSDTNDKIIVTSIDDIVIFTEQDSSMSAISSSDITITSLDLSPSGGAPIVNTLNSSGELTFEFATSTAGLYIITFNIPVVGFAKYVPVAGTTPSTTPGLENQIIWYIRGGTSSGAAFVQEEDPNEGVALQVAADRHQQSIPIVIEPNYP